MTEETEKAAEQEEAQQHATSTSPNDMSTRSKINNNNYTKCSSEGNEVSGSTHIYNGFKNLEDEGACAFPVVEDADNEENENFLATRRQLSASSVTESEEESNATVPDESPNSCPISITITQHVEQDLISSSSVGTSNESLVICSHSSGTITTPPNASNATGDGNRRHSKSSSLPHGVKLCSESTTTKNNGSGNSSDETDNQTEEKWVKLEAELKKALEEVKAKDDEVEKLKGIRQQVEGELEDLTASLFVEAHKMVSEAKMKEISSEKSLKEAQMQMDGLQAEVAALKALLITSTPSRPNLGASGSNGSNGISIFKKQHKRFPSHNQLQYGRTENETDKEKARSGEPKPIETDPSLIDPTFHRLFVEWKQEPSLTVKDKSPFLQKVYNEDIDPCLVFENSALVKRLKKAIEENSIWVEPVAEKDKNNIPKDCALLGVPRICHYRLSFDYQSDEWFEISQFCRDRIAAVCEFLNYLRYIRNGLVKSSVDIAYWEVIRLRRQMAMAKLGITMQ